MSGLQKPNNGLDGNTQYDSDPTADLNELKKLMETRNAEAIVKVFVLLNFCFNHD